MALGKTVVIDQLPESAFRHLDSAVVCVDVFLFSTSAVTAVATGRRTIPVAWADGAHGLDSAFGAFIPAVEPGFPAPTPFDTRWGPARLEGLGDVTRPLVLLSPTARLLDNARGCPETYVACLRNLTATVEALASRHRRVAIVAAGQGGETRCEDQLVSAWLARALVDRGFEPLGRLTHRELARWDRAELAITRLGKGAGLLRDLGRIEDLEFVLDRVDDIDLACTVVGGEVVRLVDMCEKQAV
jgi:phosphosulfolactate phosphohydrolase-like enzyme